MGIIVASMLSARTLAILAVTLLSAEAGKDLDQQWQDFKTKYAKDYTNEIELARRAVWEDNYHFMEEHNAAYKKGLKTYEVGENEYNDLSHAEFVNMMNGLHYSESDREENPVFSSNLVAPLPEEVDWRPKGFVTPIKNQKMCGSCWAFSTTGSLEGATLSSWTDIKKGSEADLAAAVAVVGPISVGIDAGHRGFQMYKKGIYFEKMCSSVHLDHGVLAVGYGAKKHENGKKDKFWIVKNSWGTTWGDKG